MKTKYCFWLAALAFHLIDSEARSQNATDFLTNGLIAYYPLNGNAQDHSGNGYDGTVYGATPTMDRFGVPGMAYEFNGSNDYIAANVPILPTGSAPRTASLWAKAEIPNPLAGMQMVWWGFTNGYSFGASFCILDNGSQSEDGIYSYQGGGEGGGSGVDSGIAIDNNWHHLAVSYDGTNENIYVDGTLLGVNPTGISTPISPLIIGAAEEGTNGGLQEFFSGAINELRIYNRALSSQEVVGLYQSFILGIVTTPTVEITGDLNQSYSIQYITNVSSTNWTTLASNIVIQSNPYYFPDTNAIGQGQRFYRVVSE